MNANLFIDSILGVEIVVIHKLMNEWDSMSPLRHREPGAELSASLHIDYGRNNAVGVLALYAALFGKTPLHNGEEYSLRFIYVTNEKGDRIKMYLRGKLNHYISGGELELIKKQVMIDLMNYYKKYCHKGFAPLMKYCLDRDHGITRTDFTKVVQETGFNIPGNLFRQNREVLSCKINDSELSILPNGQLMTIIDRDGELTMYLSDCHIADSQCKLLEQPPVEKSNNAYADVLFCDLDTLMDDWNYYVGTL